jgi:4-hydroxybenzoate polyprenyltransferase
MWLCALTLSLGVLCTVNALLFDVPDVEEDRENTVPTVALSWGIGVNRRLSIAGCLIACGLAWWGLDKPLPVVAVALFLIFAALRITEKTKKTTIAFWVDGCLMLPLGAQLLGSLL